MGATSSRGPGASTSTDDFSAVKRGPLGASARSAGSTHVCTPSPSDVLLRAMLDALRSLECGHAWEAGNILRHVLIRNGRRPPEAADDARRPHRGSAA
jgi:hypothetical protein